MTLKVRSQRNTLLVYRAYSILTYLIIHLRIKISTEWQPSFRLKMARFASCQMGPLFPSWTQWLAGAEESIYVSNAGIVDRLPDWFSSAFSNVSVIDMSNNQLYGGLPTNMELMSLRELYLSSNRLSGQIPPLPPSLTVLDISMNSVGPLPSNLGLQNVETIVLFSNQVTDHIPRSICKFELLGELDLANNFFDGELPLCSRKMRHLNSLDLSNNSLSGECPIFVKDNAFLMLLDLAWNNFFGTLPTWIGNSVGLNFLRLSHNKFSGTIPESITNLQCLQYLDIADNYLSGSLPVHLSNLTAMRSNYWTGAHLPETRHHQLSCHFYLSPEGYHGVSLSAFTKGQQLNYGSGFSFFFLKM